MYSLCTPPVGTTDTIPPCTVQFVQGPWILSQIQSWLLDFCCENDLQDEFVGIFNFFFSRYVLTNFFWSVTLKFEVWVIFAFRFSQIPLKIRRLILTSWLFVAKWLARRWSLGFFKFYLLSRFNDFFSASLWSCLFTMMDRPIPYIFSGHSIQV